VTARNGGQWLGALAAVALVTGCAPETGPLLREDFERLRADLIRSQQVLQKGQTDLRTEFQQGDARTAQTLTEVQRSVARLQSRVDELARDTGQIQGRLDELRKRVDLLSLQLDVTGAPAGGPSAPGKAPGARLSAGPGPPGGPGPASTGGGGGVSPLPPGTGAAPSSGGAMTPSAAGTASSGSGLTAGPGFSPPSSPSSGVAPLPAATPAPTPQSPTAAAMPGTDLYQIAYMDYTKGNYNLAIAGFREYLRLNPTAELGEKAQYWIGESHFSQGRLLQARGEKDRSLKEFEQAIQAFRQVYVDHPRGARVPAAAYKEALTLVEIGQPALAEARLQWLVDSYPSTEEAAKARDDLTRLKKP